MTTNNLDQANFTDTDTMSDRSNFLNYKYLAMENLAQKQEQLLQSLRHKYWDQRRRATSVEHLPPGRSLGPSLAAYIFDVDHSLQKDIRKNKFLQQNNNNLTTTKVIQKSSSRSPRRTGAAFEGNGVPRVLHGGRFKQINRLYDIRDLNQTK